MSKSTCKPILFLNEGKEDSEACRIMISSGIDCEFRGPTLEDITPLILFRCQRFRGIDRIREFVSEFTKNPEQ
jgi:hypothetical protein